MKDCIQPVFRKVPDNQRVVGDYSFWRAACYVPRNLTRTYDDFCLIGVAVCPLRMRVPVYQSIRPLQKLTYMIVLLMICILVFGYLLYALLNPEKF